jgi:hypothetical protein
MRDFSVIIFTAYCVTYENLISFTVSLGDQVDGFNRQQNIEEVINKSAYKSKYIRVKQSALNTD